MKLHLANFPGRLALSTCLREILLIPMLSNTNDAIYIYIYNLLLMYLKTGISYLIILRLVNRKCIECSKELKKQTTDMNNCILNA